MTLTVTFDVHVAYVLTFPELPLKTTGHFLKEWKKPLSQPAWQATSFTATQRQLTVFNFKYLTN